MVMASIERKRVRAVNWTSHKETKGKAERRNATSTLKNLQGQMTDLWDSEELKIIQTRVKLSWADITSLQLSKILNCISRPLVFTNPKATYVKTSWKYLKPMLTLCSCVIEHSHVVSEKNRNFLCSEKCFILTKADTSQSSMTYKSRISSTCQIYYHLPIMFSKIFFNTWTFGKQ